MGHHDPGGDRLSLHQQRQDRAADRRGRGHDRSACARRPTRSSPHSSAGRRSACCGCWSTARGTGKALLAASMNPRGVTLLGHRAVDTSTSRSGRSTALLAGIAGMLLGMFLGVSSYSAGPLTASAFSIVVLGGLGSVSGSLIAAYVVGYLETITAYLISPAYRTHPGAAAAGRGDVCAAAGPVRAALADAALSIKLSGYRCIGLRCCVIGACCRSIVSGYVLGLLTVAYLLRGLRDVVGPAVRLRRRSEFRPDLPDRPGRLYRRHPRRLAFAADLAVAVRRRRRVPPS